MDFDLFIDQFIDLYRSGAYGEALRLIDSEGTQLAEIRPQMMAWRSAMLARLGRTDEALRELEEADAQGYWYDERALRGDEDFAGMQGLPGFNALIERFAARRAAAAVARIQPERKLTLPAGPGPHPLFVMLHGNSSNIVEMDRRWQPVVQQGWALASLQSTQPAWASGIYVWDDVPRALNEVQVHLEGLACQPEVDAQTVVAGGFSMGAHAAVYMALDPRFSLRGVVAHEAWFNEEAMADLEQAIQAAAPNSTRVVLLAGRENAEYAAMARKIHAMLSARGFASLHLETSNPTHGYPQDFGQVLAEAIRWAME